MSGEHCDRDGGVCESCGPADDEPSACACCGLPILVVNVKVVGRKGCDVFVGRPSKWGNPFRMVYADRNEPAEHQRVINRYRAWLMSDDRLMNAARAELRGKVLGCFCAPKPCHADVLAEVANARIDAVLEGVSDE